MLTSIPGRVALCALVAAALTDIAIAWMAWGSGVWLSDVVAYDPSPCVGACCTASGCAVVTDFGCQVIGGVYKGDGADCDPDPCLPPAAGGCCQGANCFIFSAAACGQVGGIYLGDDAPCTPGACDDCNSNGVPDALDISTGTSPDCNANGRPDECDLVPGSGTTVRLRVKVWTDGRDELIVRSNRVWWQHWDFNVPGQEGANFPTYLNGAEWFPQWPDGTASGAESTAYTRLSPRAPLLDAALELNRIAARHNVSVTQFPSAGNDYTTRVEFDDNPFGGAAWYEVELVWTFDGAVSLDCNANNIPDECDIASGFSEDLDGNGVPDECEVVTTGACCLPDGGCTPDKLSAACVQAGGFFLGAGSACGSCPPVGACCTAGLLGAQPATNRIVRVSPQTGSVLPALTPPAAGMLPGHVRIGLALGGDVLYYINSDANPTTIYELDPASGSLVRSVPIPLPSKGCDHSHIDDPDPRNVPVTNWSIGALAVYGSHIIFDHSTFPDLHRLTIGGGETIFWGTSAVLPRRAIGGDNTERVFVLTTDNFIKEVSALVNTAPVRSFVAPATDIEGLAFNGTTLYASSAAGLLYTLDPNTGSVLSTVSVADGALYGLAASGDTSGCRILSQSACAAAGGTWAGSGTDCADADNNGLADACQPSPPPVPGACCVGFACSVVTLDDCAAVGGQFRGEGSTCDGSPCGVPPGACCLPAGGCVSTANAAACAASGGVFQGHGTVCGSVVCLVDPCFRDSDGDGTVDCLDGCPLDPQRTSPGPCGCNALDSDGDGVPDCIDNCPTVSNPSQADSNGNGIGDACDDETGRPGPDVPEPRNFVRDVANLIGGRQPSGEFSQAVGGLGSTVDGVPGNTLGTDSAGRPDPNAAAEAEAARQLENFAISLGLCPMASLVLVGLTLMGVHLSRRRAAP